MQEPGGRYRSLDGLRGVAALSVIAYHALLVVPAMSVLYIEKTSPSPFTPEWWLYRTPLRLVMPGHEAVLVFFVLSGFVLTAPLLRHGLTPRATLAYYCRRLIRLYVPVWGAVAFALLLAMLVHRDPSIGSSWLATHHPPTVTDVWHDLLLILGTSNLDSPLWSLTWEVWFSLLLPVLFLLVRALRVERWWPGAIALLIVVSVVSRFPAVVHRLPQSWLTAGLLQYLPVFGLGMVLAVVMPRLGELTARIRTWWPIGIALALLVVSPTLLPTSGYDALAAVLYALCLVGVTGTVTAALFWPQARHALETRPVQWAGTRSFSIYLVHEPILVAAALATAADSWSWLLLAAALIPLVLVVAEVFHRVIEAPSMRLSREVGRRVGAGARVAAPSAADAP